MKEGYRHIARRTFFAFVLTFLVTRIVVMLVMTGRMPDIFVYSGETHVHHLNYGIVILAAVGGYLLFARPGQKGLSWAALVYGAALALTFDEFGMWFHLGGLYWARASFDAVVVVAGILALAAVAPTIRRFRPQHWTTVVILALTLVVFGMMVFDSLRYANRVVLPKMQKIESQFPQKGAQP